MGEGVSLLAGTAGKVSSTLQVGVGTMSGGGDGVGAAGMNFSTGSSGLGSPSRLEMVEMDEVGSTVDSLVRNQVSHSSLVASGWLCAWVIVAMVGIEG